MSGDEITGRCYCGNVRYRLTNGIDGAGICYCEDCTRVVGSLVTVWTIIPAGGIEFTQGEPTYFKSSPSATRTFCPRCGTSLTYHHCDAKQMDVSTATLDDPSLSPPTSDGPDSARPSWMTALANKPMVETA